VSDFYPFRYAGSLWVMRSDGSHRRRLEADVKRQLDLAGSFSPRTGELAFTRLISELPQDGGLILNTGAIYSMRLDGSAVHQLQDHAAGPTFSPDGTRISFTSDRHRNGTNQGEDEYSYATELYVMNADGSGTRRLTSTHDRSEEGPSWSADGHWILYTVYASTDIPDAARISAIRPDGSCRRALVWDRANQILYSAPAWRPHRGALALDRACR
jgi:Tol biopolymer transport system component